MKSERERVSSFSRTHEDEEENLDMRSPTRIIRGHM